MTAPKVRVHEISKILGVSNAEVIDVLAKQFKVQAKSHSSTVEQDIADKLIAAMKGASTAPKPTKEAPSKQASPPASKISPKKPEAKMPVEAPPQPAKANPEAEKPTTAASPKIEETAPRTIKPLPSFPSPQYRPGVSQTGQRPPQGQYGPRPQPPNGPGQYGPRPQPAAGQGQYPPRNPQATQGAGQYPPRSPQQPGSAPARPGFGPNRGPAQPYRPSNQRGNQSKGSQHSQRAPQVERITPRQKREEELAAQAALPKICSIDEPLDIRALAEKLRMRDTEVIKHLFMKGMMVTVNQTLDIDFAKGVARELGFEVIETEVVKHEGEYTHLSNEPAKVLDADQSKNLQPRSPVVSIMGHVDHGKTTLLDSIRQTRHKVVDSEAGGITQSIGAYTVEKEDQTIVFLDTPGHEAFTAMRMRGAQATDIAILVVSADDGVMPQTIEAINHAKVAKIPIIVAVNKIDKADADPDRVLVQLSEYGLSAEKWGGDTLTVEVSALQKLGLDDLLDSILLVSELLELKADATIPAEGVIIESQLDKRMGPVATVLVKNGTLRVGDNVLIGSTGGRIRALIDDHGARIQEAGPSTPVEILGLDSVPNAGESFKVMRNDKLFKQALADEKRKERDQRIGVSRAVSAGFSGKSEIESDNAVKENQFNLLVKADTQGSLEAVVEVLQRMTSDEVKINIVHSATGDVSEADVMLASTAKALVICFNTKADVNAQRLAELEGLNIKRYDVIYHITEDIEKWVLGQLAPETEEVQVGTAEVRQIFKVGKTGIIAGCMVTSGKLLRNAKANVMRAGKEVYSGPLNNLKRFKDDVKEVASGYECGISFDRFHDLQEGDIVEVYTVKSMERTSL